jgi:hypothetical protein
MDCTTNVNYPALSALIDPDNSAMPDLRAIELEAIKAHCTVQPVDKLGAYEVRTKSAATYGTYNSSLRTLKRFAKYNGVVPFPISPALIAKYMEYLVRHTYAKSTIVTQLAAIRAVARAVDVDGRRDKVVERVLRGVGRVKGKEPKGTAVFSETIASSSTGAL